MEPAADVTGRIATLLRVVAGAEPKGLSTTAAAVASGLPRPTVHRLATALAAEGLLDRSGAALWHLGPELFLLSLGAAARYDARNVAQPILRRLALGTGETASFSVRRGNETVCLGQEEGTFPLRSHVLHEGVRFPLGVASAGIAILAFLPAAERREYLTQAQLTSVWGESHASAAIDKRLGATRRAGYAINPGLIIEGSWGMAAAVFDPDETPIGAISLTGIAARFGRDRRPALGRELLAGAHELSLRLARQPNPQAPRSPAGAATSARGH